MRCAVALCALALLGAALAAPSWSVLKNPPESIMMGISCGDINTCYIAGGDSNVGSQHMYSTDGLQTFQIADSVGTPMLILAVASASPTSSISSGVNIGFTATQYTTNGTTFQSSETTQLITQCQDAHAFGQGAFGLVGTFGKLGGVSVSTDGGVHFRDYSWNVNTDPRYGAFPSTSTWYVVGGTWPDNNADEERSYHSVTENIHIHKKTHKLHLGRIRSSTADNDTYVAAIAKTTDGGQTFTQQMYTTTGGFYFNQISCPTEDHCVAVGEGQADPFNGAGIFVTTNGGETWNQTFFAPGLSFMAVSMYDENNGVVGGGEFSNDFVGCIYTTSDGGQTWVESRFPGLYVADFDWIDATHAYGTALTIASTSVLLKYA